MCIKLIIVKKWELKSILKYALNITIVSLIPLPFINFSFVLYQEGAENTYTYDTIICAF